MIQRRRVPNPFRRRIPTKGQVCLTRFHVTRPFWSGFNTHNIYFFLCNKKRSIFLYRNCIIFLRSFDADRYSIYLLQERYGAEIKNQCSLSPRQQYKRNLPNRKRNVFSIILIMLKKHKIYFLSQLFLLILLSQRRKLP